MRKLHIIPIVHSSTDLGNLAPQVADAKSKCFAGDFEGTAESVRDFWVGLREAIERWEIDYTSMLLFQDALPVAPEGFAGMEEKIVSDLAAQGSQNHKILSWLVDRGASLVGTESPELLMAEYELAKESLESARHSSDQDHVAGASDKKAAELLSKRDRFIAERINSALDEHSIGVLFLGMMHCLEGELAADIEVLYPFGQPRGATIH